MDKFDRVHPSVKGDGLCTFLPLLMNKHRIPGIALALIDNEKITPLERGVRNSISQVPITSSTVFEGASLSKPLIAYAALKLSEKGILNIDKPLSSFSNELKLFEDSLLSAVTLRQVLSHTAGFPAANVKKGDQVKLECDPGSQFVYSGEGFRYLGRIMEVVTGEPLAIHMQEHVFRPLHMKDSSFVWEEQYSVQAASPHDLKGFPIEKWKPTSAVASCSLHTTAVDFAHFMVAVRLFPEMLEVNFRINESLAWSLGWGIETTAQGTGFWHSGDNGTFQCFAFQRNVHGVVFMTNSANGFKLCRHILEHVAGKNHPLIEWEQFDSHNNELIDQEFLSNWWKSYDF